jgi:hypothetical protein
MPIHCTQLEPCGGVALPSMVALRDSPRGFLPSGYPWSKSLRRVLNPRLWPQGLAYLFIYFYYLHCLVVACMANHTGSRGCGRASKARTTKPSSLLCAWSAVQVVGDLAAGLKQKPKMMLTSLTLVQPAVQVVGLWQQGFIMNAKQSSSLVCVRPAGQVVGDVAGGPQSTNKNNKNYFPSLTCVRPTIKVVGDVAGGQQGLYEVIPVLVLAHQ